MLLLYVDYQCTLADGVDVESSPLVHSTDTGKLSTIQSVMDSDPTPPVQPAVNGFMATEGRHTEEITTGDSKRGGELVSFEEDLSKGSVDGNIRAEATSASGTNAAILIDLDAMPDRVESEEHTNVSFDPFDPLSGGGGQSDGSTGAEIASSKNTVESCFASDLSALLQNVSSAQTIVTTETVTTTSQGGQVTVEEKKSETVSGNLNILKSPSTPPPSPAASPAPGRHLPAPGQPGSGTSSTPSIQEQSENNSTEVSMAEASHGPDGSSSATENLVHNETVTEVKKFEDAPTETTVVEKSETKIHKDGNTTVTMTTTKVTSTSTGKTSPKRTVGSDKTEAKTEVKAAATKKVPALKSPRTTTSPSGSSAAGTGKTTPRSGDNKTKSLGPSTSPRTKTTPAPASRTQPVKKKSKQHYSSLEKY